MQHSQNLDAPQNKLVYRLWFYVTDPFERGIFSNGLFDWHTFDWIIFWQLFKICQKAFLYAHLFLNSLSARISRRPFQLKSSNRKKYGHNLLKTPGTIILTYIQVFAVLYQSLFSCNKVQRHLQSHLRPCSFTWTRVFFKRQCASVLTHPPPPLSAAYMRQWNGLPPAQVMACRLFGPKPLPEPTLYYCQFDS